MGSALACIMANVETEDITTTKYDYVTDISGLYDYSDAPQYGVYNPISNYTGYTNDDAGNIASPSGISFNSSNSANNYTVMIAPGSTIAGGGGTVNNSSIFTQANLGQTPVIRLPASDPAQVNDTTIATRLYGFKITTMYDWAMSLWPALASYQSIAVNFTYPDGAPNKNALICYNPYVDPGYNEYTLRILSYWSSGIDSIVIDPSTYTFTYSYQSNNSTFTGTASLYETWLCYGDCSQRENYFTYNGGQIGAGESYYNTSMSLSFTSTVTTGAEYGYMIPGGGVTVASDPEGGYYSTVWANGETNGVIKMVLGGTTGEQANFSVNFNSGVGWAYSLTVNDSWQARLNGEVKTLGDFRNIQVTIDTIRGVVEFRPVFDFVNYVDYKVVDTVIGSYPIMKSSGITSLTFNNGTANNAMRWIVSETTVLKNTYGAVMVDPSLNIGDYFQDMANYRLWYQSFALYGDSMTINGQTFAVSNGDITINGQNYDLNNFYVSYPVDGHVYITFNIPGKTIDLGERVNDTVSFGGTWYFTTGLYEGYESTEKVYNWAVGWSASTDLFLLLAVGLIAAAVVIARKSRRLSMSTLDYVVVIIGGVVILAFVGGFV